MLGHRFRSRCLVLVLVLCGLLAPAQAEEGWLPLAGGTPSDPPGLQAVQARPGGLQLELAVPGLGYRTVQTPRGPRGRLELPGGGWAGEVGRPELPVLRYLIEVPPAARLGLTLEPRGLREWSLEQLGLPERLLPAQEPVPKLPGAKEATPYAEEEEAYRREGWGRASRAVSLRRAVLRGRHVALVEVRPLRYDPSRGVVELWDRARLNVSFSGGSAATARREKSRLASEHLDRWIEQTIVSAGPGLAQPESGGPAAPLGSAGGPAEGAEGMVVVAYDGFVDALQPLIDWKRRSGYKVELIKTSDLGSNPTDADVKQALQQRYDDWSQPSLGFVLMVGDTDFCPIHDGSGGGNSQVTDNWYACLDGADYLPDVAIARISVRTADETSAVVDKLLTYQRATFATGAWIKRGGFIGTSDSGYIGLIEGTHDWCIDTYYTPNDYESTSWSHGYESCDRHYNSYDADTSEIAASIDEGRSMVNYSGHGGYTSWQGPTSHGGYDQADVRNNTNDGMYPFVISNACITGTLDREECFGETWQKVANRGAIAFLGASNNSYWDEDDYFQRRLHGNMFPMDEATPLGVVVNEAKIDLYEHYGDTGTVEYYFEMYNLLSEPSLLLWMRAPRDWAVSYPDTLPIGESTFEVTVTHGGAPVEGALVAARKTDDGVFESGYTDATGKVTLDLDPAPATVGPMEVTVTGQDFRPHEGVSDVISPDSPWLTHRSHEVDDSAGGDGDGHANPGETFVMPVTVENVGEQPGTGLTGTLRTTTPDWCEILDDSAAFPDLAPGELGTTLPDHFGVRVAADAPDGVLLGFDMDWSADGGASGTTSFDEQVLAIDFEVDGHTIDDAAGGNGNGVAGPGETVDMTVTLANDGHRDAYGITGLLSTASPHVTILQDTADYPDLAAGASGDSLPPPYRFEVAEDAPDQEPVTFDLTVSETGSGHEEVVPFDVMISSCGQTEATDVPKDIEDHAVAESLLDHPNAISISEVNVFVDISHTYIGDLVVTLVSPGGTECVLHDRAGGSDNDLVTWYDKETEPAEPLTVFDGENSHGTWTLRVEDEAGSDTGALEAWTLEICGDGIPPDPTVSVAGHEVVDTDACDPDGIADAGETVLYDVTLENTGWGDATGLSARLSSAAEVAVLNNPVPLPDLAPGETALASFEVLVGAVGCEQPAHFDVEVTGNEGVWTDGFDDVLEADSEPSESFEDVEHGGAEPAGWSHEAAEGTDDWGVVSTRNHTAAGQWSWFSSDVEEVKDDRLISPAYDLAEGATLEFWHWVELESGYDGGVLEITEDEGATWTDLGPHMTAGGYDRSLSGSNPIAGRDAWTGVIAEWRRTEVDLSAWAGKTVRFRWRLTCDGSVAKTGWWVDDIRVQDTEQVCDAHPCAVPGEVRLEQVWRDAGETVLSWWDDPVCTEFRVWRSDDPTGEDAFSDVTAEDPDPTDTRFRDGSGGSFRCWIVQGIGPDGDGPWGHFGR
jgi:subtilisin-like proprotein convertase family protein